MLNFNVNNTLNLKSTRLKEEYVVNLKLECGARVTPKLNLGSSRKMLSNPGMRLRNSSSVIIVTCTPHLLLIINDHVKVATLCLQF
jgi:hypothetical protein